MERIRHKRQYQLRQRMARMLALIVFACLLTGGILLIVERGFPNLWLCGTCGDFHNAYWAAQRALQGRNPYETTYQMYHYHFPPALLLILRPLVPLGIGPAFIIWSLLMITATTAAVWLLVRSYGKSAIVGLVALSPAVLLVLETGQPLPLMVLGIAAAAVAFKRDRYVLAGLCLSIAWMKPQVALLATIAILLMTPRSIPGFLVGSIVFLLPPPLWSWLSIVSSLNVEHEPLPSSIAGVWPNFLGAHHPGYWLLALGACGASVLVYQFLQHAGQRFAWLILIWFIAAPYSHPYDVVLLIIPVALLVGEFNVFVVDCWLCAFLSFYTIPMATLIPLMLVLFALTRRYSPHPVLERIPLWVAQPGHGPASSVHHS